MVLSNESYEQLVSVFVFAHDFPTTPVMLSWRLLLLEQWPMTNCSSGQVLHPCFCRLLKEFQLISFNSSLICILHPSSRAVEVIINSLTVGNASRCKFYISSFIEHTEIHYSSNKNCRSCWQYFLEVYLQPVRNPSSMHLDSALLDL